MATYADYPAHTMSSSNDFTLYQYHEEAWNQDQQYIPTSYGEPYLSQTTFDSYPAQPSYAPLQDQYDYSAQPAVAQMKNSHWSPAISASHSLDYQNPPVLSSTSDSGASAMSSAMGSPSSHPQSSDWAQQQNINMFPSIVQPSESLFQTTSFDFETIPVTDKGCVDPALIQPFSPTQYTGTQFPEPQGYAQSPPPMQYPHAPSPAPSNASRTGKIPSSASPHMRAQAWQPYPTHNVSRRQSISSVHSRHSQHSHSSDDSNKGLCPIATCGRHVKDLKAHMLTHQNERPEKCPIPTCEYHTKGFARKYDKNRHTLTHYKGTMVCGFCPGSGSAAEKSFNRADVFKRHLTSVHGVEQTPPNARRKSPTSAGKRPYNAAREVSGMCSTCNNTFASAQDFYEHLDDCVLRVVQQADPSEAINEKLLGSVAEDKQVQETMEKHMLPTTVDYNAPTSFDDDDEADEEEGDDEDTNDGTYGSRSGKSGKGVSGQEPVGVGTSHISSGGAVSKPKKGLTFSKNGVPLAGASSGKGSKRKKNYPLSWGAAPEKMKMKKRVLCVYDGQRRLWKDDMMLDADHEVRIPIGDGRSWVTDLDVQTLRRAEGLHNATPEEKGPWTQDDGELERLMQ